MLFSRFFRADLSQLTESTPLQSNFALEMIPQTEFSLGPTLDSEWTRGKALFAFKRPGDIAEEPENIFVYVYNSEIKEEVRTFEQPRIVFKYKDTFNYGGLPNPIHTIDFHPVCGYAINDEGRTLVYCFYSPTEERDGPASIFVFTLETQGSSQDLEAQSADPDNIDDPLELQIREGGLLAEEIVMDDVFSARELSFWGKRAASTLWLGDHRSVIIPSDKSFTLVFNANDKSVTEFSQLQDGLEWGQNVLYATSATQQDFVNMGCTPT